jgi:hypothetical protein
MNYEAGLLAFLLFYVPMFFVYENFKKNNEKTDEEYRKAINEK